VTTKGSAVRRALDELNERKSLQPITQGEINDLGQVALWRILLEPYVPRKRGMIERPPEVDQAERIISKVGRVVQVGCFAYHSKTASGLNLADAREKAEVGQYWLHEMYAGQEVHLRSGHILRIMTETELLMRVNDPDLIKGYAE
jgi:hypothetical protein